MVAVVWGVKPPPEFCAGGGYVLDREGSSHGDESGCDSNRNRVAPGILPSGLASVGCDGSHGARVRALQNGNRCYQDGQVPQLADPAGRGRERGIQVLALDGSNAINIARRAEDRDCADVAEDGWVEV